MREATREAIGVAADGDRGIASDYEIQEIYPRANAASGKGAILSAGGGVGQIREGFWTDSAHRRWEVVFLVSSSDSLGDRQGFIILHLSYLWTTIRDAEGDILAGRYLQEDEFPRVGQIREIDGFQLLVRKQSDLGAPFKDSVSDLSPAVRFGGRFWVLAEQDDKLDDEYGDVLAEVLTPVVPSPSTPSPSTALLQERKVRRDPILARKKMEASPRKPWVGSIPKDPVNS
ncbi:hypothetical protein ZWY2020_037481 [Hordeum vulgare]|nr:hypothetical protein ZWY2020_037481 [Hordeum vulgare]